MWNFVSEVRIIPDVEKTIINNVRLLSRKFNYVFTTGGIGPTTMILQLNQSLKLKVKYEFIKNHMLLEIYGKI